VLTRVDPPLTIAPQGSLAVFCDELLDRIALRRRWALHRHVHLLAAFDACVRQQRIGSFLSIGCGLGLSELYLAAHHPQVEFTLTDFDERRIKSARRIAAHGRLENVRFAQLDLLDPPDGIRFDVVASIEVMEHIEDDRRAAANYRALASSYLYVLVPGCSEADLTDEREIASAWRRCKHYRPGYTERTLPALFEGADVEWLRPCYIRPDALQLRLEVEAIDDERVRATRGALFARAARDVGLEFPVTEGAAGIELLAHV
jgi:SAM-dependent methyltransferase